MKFSQLTKWEKEEVILKILQYYPQGLKIPEFTQILKLKNNMPLRRILVQLVKEKKIKIIKLGQIKSYMDYKKWEAIVNK